MVLPSIPMEQVVVWSLTVSSEVGKSKDVHAIFIEVGEQAEFQYSNIEAFQACFQICCFGL